MLKVSIDLATGRPILTDDCSGEATYAQVPKKISILADGEMSIESGGGVRIFTVNTASPSGLTIMKRLRVESDSSFTIESGSSATALGA